jgi:hypothetical protein
MTIDTEAASGMLGNFVIERDDLTVPEIRSSAPSCKIGMQMALI